MDLINKHISKHLPHLKDEEDSFFQEIFELIQSVVKEKHILLLRYIHLILNETFLKETSEVKSLHLHLDNNFNDDSLLVISQYLLVRFYKESIQQSTTSQEKSKLGNKKSELRLKLIQLKQACPEGAGGKSRAFKNWMQNIKNTRSLINFYNQLNEDVEVACDTILNCQVSLSDSLSNLYMTKPYACKIEDFQNYPTFNLLNSKLTLNQVDEIDNSIIDNLKNIIIFDCERKKMMRYFSLQDIRDYDINLKKYLIITFGDENTPIQNLRKKTNLMLDRFKIGRDNSYSIIRSEIDCSLGLESKKYIPVSFVGIDTSHFFDTFMLETNIQELYELRSIKMLNVYSLCFSREIKSYILEEIFSPKETSNLISDETKRRLLDLRDEDLSSLKESLNQLLDLIINSGIQQILASKTKSNTFFIVDAFLLNSKKLTYLISLALHLTEKNGFFSWADFDKIRNESIIVLSYQDQGKYPYCFYPNLTESMISKDATIEAVFHKFLFLNRYKWAKLNISKDIYKLTDSPFRKQYFQWERLKDPINSLKPQKSDDTNWDLEQQYSGNINRETIKLKSKNERERTFTSSELFIYSIDNSTFRVEKIKDIIEIFDENAKCFVYHLDEIQKNINLYEKMIDTTQQEEELNVIRQQFQIDDPEAGRLWKILLRNKSLLSGEEILYDSLKAHLEKKGLKIVSLHHFKTNWLNPESDSIAPLNKKIFIELCNFLELPKTYFILIQRLRNASKQASRRSTLQMNRLLQNLINDSCFDNGVDLNKIIVSNLGKYKREHPLDELGIDENHLGENLITLVELIKPEITLKEVEKIKKTSNE